LRDEGVGRGDGGNGIAAVESGIRLDDGDSLAEGDGALPVQVKVAVSPVTERELIWE
jgi:hypothetical protein